MAPHRRLGRRLAVLLSVLRCRPLSRLTHERPPPVRQALRPVRVLAPAVPLQQVARVLQRGGERGDHRYLAIHLRTADTTTGGP